MKKTAKMLKGLLLLSLLLLMTNCATEEIGQKNVAQSSTEAKIWFDNHQKDYSATVLNYIGDLQWQNAITSQGDMGEIIEVPFTLASGLVASTKEADQYNDHHRLMFVKDEQKEFKLSYIQIFANDENYNIQDKNYNYYNIKDNFDGNIYVQELATNIRRKIEFKEGQKIAPSLTAKMREMACLYYGYWDGTGRFTPLYEVACYSGGPTGDPENAQPNYGGGNSGTTPKPSESCPAGYVYKLGECVLVAKITNLLEGKAKCLNDLLNKNGDSFVQNLLANFEGASKWDISIVSKDKVTSAKDGIIKEVNGKTLPPVGNLIEIEISSSKAETNSSLDVARTILHEYIHADIFRKLGIETSVTDKEGLDFKKTYEAYGEQHSTIAILYLNSMKEALKSFHKTALLDDYKKYTQYYGEEPSDAFYEALAWGGLQDANVKAWTDLPADKKAAIEALAKRVPMLSKTVPCSSK